MWLNLNSMSKLSFDYNNDAVAEDKEAWHMQFLSVIYLARSQ